MSRSLKFLTRNKKLLAVIVGLSTLALLPWNLPPVWAQSQEGGLPALASRVQVLENLVTTLSAALASETTARQAADATLQGSINAETTARQAADATFLASINAETAARQAADATLQGSINAETTARQGADATLATQINTRGKAYTAISNVQFLPNGAETVLASLNLPAGSYFLIGHVNVSNPDHDAGWGCHLCIAGDICFVGSAADTESPNFAGGTVSAANITVTDVYTLAAPTTITLGCVSGEPSSYINGANLIAISVGI